MTGVADEIFAHQVVAVRCRASFPLPELEDVFAKISCEDIKTVNLEPIPCLLNFGQ